MTESTAGVLVELHAASFGWGGRAVVGPVDVAVQRGDYLAVLGPNGSGKSTLARGLLGLLPPLSGRCTRWTERLGFVPQREALDPVWPITVEEVVRTGAAGRLHGLRSFSRTEREAARARMAEVGRLRTAQAALSRLVWWSTPTRHDRAGFGVRARAVGAG